MYLKDCVTDYHNYDTRGKKWCRMKWEHKGIVAYNSLKHGLFRLGAVEPHKHDAAIIEVLKQLN